MTEEKAEVSARTPGNGDPELRYEQHPQMFKDSPFLFIGCLILIPLFGLGIILLLIWYIKSRSEKLTITSEYMLYEKGILSKHRTETQLDRIRSVGVYQSLMHRMFNVGNISVYTAGDSPEVVAKGLPRPYDIRDLLR